MKLLSKCFALSLFLVSQALAYSPTIFGPNDVSTNLQSGIRFKLNGPAILTGSLDPTVSAVDAKAGSLYISSVGAVYSKNDNGLNTHWTQLGSGGGGGSPGAPDGSIQYNVSGSFHGDSNFMRDALTGNTFALSQIRADGFSDDQSVELSADNLGDIGNVSVVFDGVSDNATVVAAFNVANPTKTVTLAQGNPTDVLPAQTILVQGGGVGGFTAGETGVTGLPIGGAYIYTKDSTNSWTMLTGAGGAAQIIGSPLSVLSGVLGAVNSFHILTIQPSGQPFQQLGVGDNGSYQSTVGMGQAGVEIKYTGGGVENTIDVTPSDVSWTSNGLNYHLPSGSVPSLNQNISVASISGSDVYLHYSSGGGGGLPSGTQYNQALFWDQATAQPLWQNFYAITDESLNNTVLGYKAWGIAGGNPYTPGGSIDDTIVGAHAFEQLNGGTITAFGVRNQNHSSSTNFFNVFGSDNAGDGTTNISHSNIFGRGNVWGPNGSGLSGVEIFGDSNHATGSDTVIVGHDITSFAPNSILIGHDITTNPFATSSHLIAMGATMGFPNITTGHDLLVLGGWGGPGNFTTAIQTVCLLGSCNNVTSGGYNTAINNAGQSITSENLNTLIGYGSDITVANQYSIALGAYAKTTQSNQLQIGNNAFTQINHVRFDTNGSNLDTKLDNGTGYQASGSQYDVFGGGSTGTQFGGGWTFWATAPGDPTTMSASPNTHSRWATFAPQISAMGDMDGVSSNIYSQMNNQRGMGNYFIHGVTLGPVASSISYTGVTGGVEDGLLSGSFIGPVSASYTATITYIHNQEINYTIATGVTPQVGDTFATMDGRSGVVIGTGSLGYMIVSLTSGSGLDNPIANGAFLSGSGAIWSVQLTSDGVLYADVYDAADDHGHTFPGENCAAVQTLSYGSQLGFSQPRGHDIGLVLNWSYATTYGNIFSFDQPTNVAVMGDVNSVIDAALPAQISFDLLNSQIGVQGRKVKLGASSIGNNTHIDINDDNQTISMSKVTGYAGDSTAANGLVAIVGLSSFPGQTAPITPTTIFTPPADGIYEVSAFGINTSAGSAGYVALNLGYTNSGGPQSAQLGVVDAATVGAQTKISPITIFAQAGTTIDVSSSEVGVVGGYTMDIYFYAKKIK